MTEIMEKFQEGAARISRTRIAERISPEGHVDKHKATSATSLLSLQAVSNPVHIAAQAGFAKDAVVYEKIKSISENGHFVQLVSREILSPHHLSNFSTNGWLSHARKNFNF